MANAYERHDISDESWAKIEFLLPGRKGTWGGNARDNRQFINAVFWILRTGAPWRDLPPSYGDWKVTEIGKILTGVFAVGVTKEFGRNYCRN